MRNRACRDSRAGTAPPGSPLSRGGRHRVESDLGRAWATIDGAGEMTPAAFGGEDAPPLLGAYTLEGMGPAVDPVAQRLVPTEMIMYSNHRTGW